MTLSDDKWGRKTHRTAARGVVTLRDHVKSAESEIPQTLEENTDGYAIFPSEYEPSEDERSIDLILEALSEPESTEETDEDRRLPPWLRDLERVKGSAVLELDSDGSVTRLLVMDGKICFGMDRGGTPVIDDSLVAENLALASALKELYADRAKEGATHLGLAVLGEAELHGLSPDIRESLRGQLRRALLQSLNAGNVFLRDLAPGDPELKSVPRHPIAFRTFEVLQDVWDETDSVVSAFHASDEGCVVSALFRRRWNDAPRFEEVVHVSGIARLAALEGLVSIARDLHGLAAIVDPDHQAELAYATTDQLGVVYFASGDFVAVHIYPILHGARGLGAARAALERSR